MTRATWLRKTVLTVSLTGMGLVAALSVAVAWPMVRAHWVVKTWLYGRNPEQRKQAAREIPTLGKHVVPLLVTCSRTNSANRKPVRRPFGCSKR